MRNLAGKGRFDLALLQALHAYPYPHDGAGLKDANPAQIGLGMADGNPLGVADQIPAHFALSADST